MRILKFTGVCVSVILLAGMHSIAQEQIERAPINQKFLEYQQKGENGGLIPAPFKLDFSSFDKKYSDKANLPVSFDLRTENAVSGVKNQGNYGTCWSFSAMASIESRFLKLENQEYDFSEKNMVTCSGFLRGVDDGGNIFMASAYASRGFLLENDDPYSLLSKYSTCTEKKPRYYATEIRWLPQNQNILKGFIMNYGAISASMYIVHNYDYLNANDHTYYYDGDKEANHAITIVGWDDNKTMAGGTLSPENGKGGWLIKNSYGKDYGDKGYFFQAFNDSKSSVSCATYLDFLSSNDVDSLYMVDSLGMLSAVGYNEPQANGLIKFVANGTDFIGKVGTMIANPSTTISIEIYDDFNPSTNTLSNKLAQVDDKFCLYPGYYTFDVNATVNSDFYIRIKYDAENALFPVAVEAVSEQLKDYAVPSISSAGTCFLSYDGAKWEDLSTFDMDLCIRAYSIKKEDLSAQLAVDKNSICQNESVVFTDLSEGDIISYAWDFGEGAEPQHASGKGPHEVSYTTSGVKTASLTIEGVDKAVQVVKKDFIEVYEQVPVYIENYDMIVEKDQLFTITAYGGADSYVWEGHNIIKQDANYIKARIEEDLDGEIYYKVTATKNTCSGSDSIRVSLKNSTDIQVINKTDQYFIISPNPAADYVKIQAPNAVKGIFTITLVAADGLVAKQKQLNVFDDEQVSINTASLASGIYFVQIVGENHNEVHKLLIR